MEKVKNGLLPLSADEATRHPRSGTGKRREPVAAVELIEALRDHRPVHHDILVFLVDFVRTTPWVTDRMTR